ncbi:TraB family protein [Desulfobulbus propionicus DSM 2032]|jgi:pheromone shutdown-related protein TraB|uniref:TraB family protein n=1 Tax=Desulfobulbus propionicus (strain ATCC 33891 / DSM 2032 / VKM B-1956 / 1pr3) TaxID=577650 RepID=A0A7U3YKH4_DESPD|nr:TraB/GumN family protein [Desulfobulbus propionicus]ADW17054.1 TraB family protein [Desulfobulbus propionicus DSM 2032]
MKTSNFPTHPYPDDVTTIHLKDKTILLIGTAHISQQSTDLVKQVIVQEQPDAVCIELDEKRHAALAKRDTWENLDVKQVVRNKQLATLMVNLILAAYQKKLGGQLGIMPGTELLAASQTAEQLGIPIVLCDRDVRITLRRAWRATSFCKKGYLLATLLTSLFDKTVLDEEQLTAMRRKDVLSELINEMGAALPHTKEVLIDERDIYMAEKIKQTAGRRLVAVVGAGHTEGIRRAIGQDNRDRMEAINAIPPTGRTAKILGWLIPGLILLGLLLIGIRQGTAEFTANAVYWILAHGIPSSLGAVIALAHPATIVSAFAAAPITSLSPLIGAGYVCAFIQVMICPPVVREFEIAAQDIATVSGWWRNKLLRIFLVFILTTLGSSIGTWIGGYRIVDTLLN